jgi:tetratricopeptide (TPR) repeat protein
MADSYVLLTSYGLLAPNQAYPKAEELATKALELDDTLAEPHTALGFARSFYDCDWTAASREFQRAIDLNPNYPTAHVWYGEHLANLGQSERAVSEFRHARELDPLSLFVNASYGRILRDARHFDEAIEQCRKTIELEPNFAHGHWCLGLAYLGKGRPDDAVFELQKVRALGEGPIALWALGYAYGVVGKRREAQDVLSELRGESQRSYVSPYFLAGIYAGLGDKDRAFEYLQMAYEQHDTLQLELDPFLDSLRSDHRFHELLRRMNLPLDVRPGFREIGR